MICRYKEQADKVASLSGTSDEIDLTFRRKDSFEDQTLALV